MLGQVRLSDPARWTGVPPLFPQEPLLAIGYRSRFTTPLDPDALASLVAHARRANAAAGVSGILILDAGEVFQWIEGPESAVEALMAKIAADPRHADIQVLQHTELDHRLFGPWTMLMASGPERLQTLDRGVSVVPRSVLVALREGGLTPREVLARSADDLRPTVHAFKQTRAAAEPRISAWRFNAHHVASRVDACLRVGLRASLPPLRDQGLSLAAGGLAQLVLEDDQDAAEHLVERMAAPRADRLAVQIDLFEDAARRLGDHHHDGWYQEQMLHGALTNIIRLVRRLNSKASPMPQHQGFARPRVLVTTLPGAKHFLGAILAAEVLWQRGARPFLAFPKCADEVVTMLGEAAFDAVHIALDSAVIRTSEVAQTPALVGAARKVSRNAGLVVTATGRFTAETDQAAPRLAVDEAFASALQTVQIIDNAPLGATSRMA